MSISNNIRGNLFSNPERVDIKIEQDKVEKDIKIAYENHVGSKVQEVSHRVVLFIGRSRAGKTTVKKMLVNPTQTTESLDTQADMNGPSLTSMVISDKNIVLDFIDTPGILERVNIFNRTKRRDDDRIFELITGCINMEVTKIHLFCFVVPFHAFRDYDQGDDFRALENWIQFLGNNIANNSCLIITRCESRNHDELQKLETMINNVDYFPTMANFFKKGIFYSGALNGEDWNGDPRKLYSQFEIVCEYRKQLIDLFISDIEPYDVKRSAMSEFNQAIRKIKNIIKNKIPQNWWTWLIIGLFTIIALLVAIIIKLAR